MRRYLLDSGIANEYMAQRDPVFARAKAAVRAGHRIGVPVPIYGELVYGIEYAPPASRPAAYRNLRIALGTWTIWPFDRRAAEEFGRLRADRRRHGRQMQVLDPQLAAVALTLGSCTVVSSDSDLLAVPGLAVENWAA